MKTYSIAVPTTPTELSTLFPDMPRRVDLLLIQNVETNIASINFGDAGNQPFSIVSPNYVNFSPGSPKGIYVVGTSGDILTVGYR